MAPHDRFLNSRARIEPYAPLGRVFSVVRETWRLQDDPKRVGPKIELLAAQRSASDAAEFAREAAVAQPQHGFHKASGAWWGSDGEDFHRFRITTRRPAALTTVLLPLLVGVVASVFLSRRSRGSD